MKRPGLLAEQRDSAEAALRHSDLRRALRTTVGFMGPLLLAHLGAIGGPVIFSAIAAQNVALMDVRGAYGVRANLLLAKTAILVGATWLGFAVAGNAFAAVLATGLIALFMGLWRHLSSDYGPSLAAASALLFLIALASPESVPALAVLHALGGGLWGIALQASLWPFRAEHPLRQTAAESWAALGDLFAAMSLDDTRLPDQRHREVIDRETNVRQTLNRTTSLLDSTSRPSLLRSRLDSLNLSAARLATRVTVFHGALDALRPEPTFTALVPMVQPVLASLTNLSRAVGQAVVSRQPSHLATAEVRVQRLSNLIQVLQGQIAAQVTPAATAAELNELLRQVAAQLPDLLRELRAVIERAGERGAFSLELFDLDSWSARPLVSTLHLSARVDASLARFTARLGVLLMVGVAIFEFWKIERGYWLPLTVVVVLQPDYGSTRLRAAQRLLGTLIGATVASLLLWLKLPPPAHLAAIAGTIFGFSYYLRKNYAVAVFFVTLMIVLLTETATTVTLAFTVERLLATLAGGTLAMLAAIVFWPVWEWQRFPSFLATAIRANRDYLGVLRERLRTGGTYDATAIAAKRRAETSNGMVFASLQRMAGDPKRQQERLAQAAALANGNQRLTRALTTIALHLTPGQILNHVELARFTELAFDALDALAAHVETTGPGPIPLAPFLSRLERFQSPVLAAKPARDVDQREHWVFAQLSRIALELSAMLLAETHADSLSSSPSPATHALDASPG